MERRKFTREFKLEAVKLIQERGVTVAQAAVVRFDIEKLKEACAGMGMATRTCRTRSESCGAHGRNAHDR
jgi:hypothetical protein